MGDLSCRSYLLRENLSLLEQGKQVLEMISVEDYTRLPERGTLGGASGKSSGGTVGHHCRHVCNFYQQLCFSDDAPDNASDNTTVNYDRRFRDPAIEQNPVAARVLVDDLLAVFASWLKKPESCPEIRTIAFTATFTGGKEVLEIPSCFDRELRAVAEHSLHHYAIIAQILPDKRYALPHNFGLAASTAAWLNS